MSVTGVESHLSFISLFHPDQVICTPKIKLSKDFIAVLRQPEPEVMDRVSYRDSIEAPVVNAQTKVAILFHHKEEACRCRCGGENIL